jgi:hypothetical protein
MSRRGANQILTKTYDADNNGNRVISLEGGSFSLPEEADAFTVELTNGGLTVVYKFRTGGVSGSVVATLSITHSAVQTLDITAGAMTYP